MELTCKCGTIIPDKDVEWDNFYNEYGEDYANIYTECPNCNLFTDINEWRHLEDLEEVKERLSRHPNFKQPTTMPLAELEKMDLICSATLKDIFDLNRTNCE